MSVDKLVDSTQLDTDLTSVANAIRAKSGGSGQLAFPAGFVSEIQAIPSGGGGDTLVVNGVGGSIQLSHSTGMPKKYKIDSPYIDNLVLCAGGQIQAALDMPLGIEEISMATGTQAATSGMTVKGDFRSQNVYQLKSVDLGFLPINNIYNFNVVYPNKAPYWESLLGLNFIKVGGANYKIGTMNNLSALKNVTCKPNTLGQLDMIASNRNWWNLSGSDLLTDASLCQIANALCATHTSTLTLHATPKARCSTLMGTVSSVTDDTGTYDFFTADANGTVTLADFITNTKGWTLA